MPAHVAKGLDNSEYTVDVAGVRMNSTRSVNKHDIDADASAC